MFFIGGKKVEFYKKKISHRKCLDMKNLKFCENYLNYLWHAKNFKHFHSNVYDQKIYPTYPGPK